MALIGLAVGAIALWLRADAVRDDRAAREAAANAARIEHITGAKEIGHGIETLDRDGFDAAIDGLPGRDSAD